MENEILHILAENSRLTNEQIAVMLDKSEEEVARVVKELENKNIVLGYPALVDWEKTGEDVVMAYIEVKVTPQRGQA